VNYKKVELKDVYIDEADDGSLWISELVHYVPEKGKEFHRWGSNRISGPGANA
jgi:hypothetical protein